MHKVQCIIMNLRGLGGVKPHVYYYEFKGFGGVMPPVYYYEFK